MLPKVLFKYDFYKDAYNWVRVVIFTSSFGVKKAERLKPIPKETQKQIRGLYKLKPISHRNLIVSRNYPAKKIVIDYLKTDKNLNKTIKLRLSELKQGWNRKERRYFDILSRVTQKPIYTQRFTCYLTTLGSCPYYERDKWFMTSVFRDLKKQIYIVGHEIMHLQFLYWYRDYCVKGGLTQNEIQDLKEAVTFLLNEPEFNKIIEFKDRGYPVHQRLRKKIKRIWRRNKDFKKFLDKIISRKEELFKKQLN